MENERKRDRNGERKRERERGGEGRETQREKSGVDRIRGKVGR